MSEYTVGVRISSSHIGHTHFAQAQPAALAGGICLFCGGDGAGEDKLHVFRVFAAPRQRPPYVHGVDPRVGMSADHVNAAAAREHGEGAERPPYAFDVAFNMPTQSIEMSSIPPSPERSSSHTA